MPRKELLFLESSNHFPTYSLPLIATPEECIYIYLTQNQEFDIGIISGYERW